MSTRNIRDQPRQTSRVRSTSRRSRLARPVSWTDTTVPRPGYPSRRMRASSASSPRRPPPEMSRRNRSITGAASSCVDKSALDESAVPAVADGCAVADDRATANEDAPDGTLDLDTLERREVARVVQVGLPDRAPRGRVEEEEVTVPANLDCALPRESEAPCRRRR